MVAATAAAEIALAPIGASLFGRITAAGLLLNLAAIPLMTLVQAGSLAVLALSPVHEGAARALGYAVHLAATGLVDSAKLVDVAPWLSREVAPPAWGLVCTYYVALILALIASAMPGRASRAWRRAFRSATALAGLAIVAGPHVTTRDGPPRPAAHQMRIVFLDVGQGDAALVMPPGGRALLVDAGGLPVAPLQDPDEGPAFDIGERVVARALRAFGVRSLDAFVVTHGDPDHIGGARSILRSFRPRAVWEGVPVPPFEPLVRLAADAADIGAEWRTVQAGDRLRLAGVEIAVLHPPPPEWERQRVRNDDSIVLEIRLGDVAVILPGDIGREGESGTRPRIVRAPITILKAPHHGSATSSTQEFLDAVRPSAVIVSAGRANRFGHPAPVVVDRYRRMGVPMFSTADNGAVVVDTDGRSAVIWTWSGRTLRLE
jgi:competence protein ComEC